MRKNSNSNIVKKKRFIDLNHNFIYFVYKPWIELQVKILYIKISKEQMSTWETRISAQIRIINLFVNLKWTKKISHLNSIKFNSGLMIIWLIKKNVFF